MKPLMKEYFDILCEWIKLGDKEADPIIEDDYRVWEQKQEDLCLKLDELGEKISEELRNKPEERNEWARSLKEAYAAIGEEL